MVGITCGRFPTGVLPTDLLAQPFNIEKRSAEGSFAREYMSRLRAAKLDVQLAGAAAVPLPRDTIVAKGTPAHADDAGRQEAGLFKKLDAFELDDDFLRPSDTAPGQHGEWSSEFKTAVAAIKAEFGGSVDVIKVSHTIVIEAAAFLVRRGLLNVKGSSNVNIKQARALFSFAIWLQHRKSIEWVKEGKLPEPPWLLEYFEYLHVGVGVCVCLYTLRINTFVLHVILIGTSLKMIAHMRISSAYWWRSAVHIALAWRRSWFRSVWLVSAMPQPCRDSTGVPSKLPCSCVSCEKRHCWKRYSVRTGSNMVISSLVNDCSCAHRRCGHGQNYDAACAGGAG